MAKTDFPPPHYSFEELSRCCFGRGVGSVGGPVGDPVGDGTGDTIAKNTWIRLMLFVIVVLIVSCCTVVVLVSIKSPPLINPTRPDKNE